MSPPRRVILRRGGAVALADGLSPPPPDPQIAERVQEVLADVRARGDDALVDATGASTARLHARPDPGSTCRPGRGGSRARWAAARRAPDRDRTGARTRRRHAPRGRQIHPSARPAHHGAGCSRRVSGYLRSGWARSVSVEPDHGRRSRAGSGGGAHRDRHAAGPRRSRGAGGAPPSPSLPVRGAHGCRRRSARCSAPSGSTASPVPARWSSSPRATSTPSPWPTTCSPRPSTVPTRRRSS